ncbi:MAG TPA: hypothetical protein VL494_13605 [Steroidobacteraceae bacterium]|jgi:hypothetical protein|nr:hypothetical protein [Steroidobacteraceae bacterium]
MSGPRDVLTFRQMARRLGWSDTRASGRKLARLIRAREKETGRRIATTTEGGHRRITESALTRYLPELRRSKVDELMGNFRAYLSDIDDRIAEGAAAYIAENVDPQIAELRADDQKLARMLDELGRRMVLVAGGNRPRKAQIRPTLSTKG